MDKVVETSNPVDRGKTVTSKIVEELISSKAVTRVTVRRNLPAVADNRIVLLQHPVDKTLVVIKEIIIPTDKVVETNPQDPVAREKGEIVYSIEQVWKIQLP